MLTAATDIRPARPSFPALRSLAANPVFRRESGFFRHEPLWIAAHFLAWTGGLLVAAILLRTYMVNHASSSGTIHVGARGAISLIANNFQFLLPFIPLALFIRRADAAIRSGYLADIATTPLRPEEILAGWLAGALLRGVIFIIIGAIAIMGYILLGWISNSPWTAIPTAVFHYGLHTAQACAWLLAGLPFALYLSLSHRRRVNALLLTIVSVGALMWLMHHTTFLLDVVTSGQFFVRSILREHLLTTGVTAGTCLGMGLLFVMKAGAQLSGYYIERLESGSPGGSQSRGPTWFRSPLFRSLWREARTPFPWLQVCLCVIAAGIATLLVIPNLLVRTNLIPIINLSYIVIVLMLFWPIASFSIRELPRLWEMALQHRRPLPPGQAAPPGAIAPITVFKTIYNPLFYLNFIVMVIAEVWCFLTGFYVAQLGFFRSYHYAILLPITGFLVLLLVQLKGSHWIVRHDGCNLAAARTQMVRTLVICLGAMAAFAFLIDAAFVQSSSPLSIWAWFLTFALAIVFPLLAWYNLQIERRMRGMTFVINDGARSSSAHITKS